MIRDLRSQTFPIAAVLIGWAVLLGGLVAIYLCDQRMVDAGRGDLAQMLDEGLAFIPPILSAAAIGSLLIVHRPRHPTGWLFLLLALLVVVSGVADGYALAETAEGNHDGVAGLIASIGDRMFILWLLVLGLILLFTPAGRLEGRLARVLAIVIVTSGLVAFALALVSSYDGLIEAEPPIENPWTVDSPAIDIARLTMIIVMHAGIIGAAGLLLARFRSSRGRRRQQLRWLALASVTFPILIVSAFVAAVLDLNTVLAILGGAVPRDHPSGRRAGDRAGPPLRH